MAKVQVNKANRLYASILADLTADKVVGWAQIREFLTIDSKAALPYDDKTWTTSSDKKALFMSHIYPLATDHVATGSPFRAPTPTAPTPVSTASLMGVLQYRSQGNTNLENILEGIAPLLERVDAARLRLDLGKLVTYMADFPPTMLLGKAMVLQPEEYKAWTDQHNKDMMLVGPMLLFKILHRSEVKWEYQEIGRTAFIIFRRNGKELFTSCKYAVDGDWETDQERDIIMKEFLNGITIKAKQIQYAHVDYRVLRYLDYFNAHHDIVSPGSGKPVTVAAKLAPPAHDTYLTSFFKDMVRLIIDDPLVATQPDEILDIIARRMGGYFQPDQLDDIQAAINAIDVSLVTDVGDYLSEMKVLCDLPEEARTAKYDELFGVKCLPGDACKKLDDAREIRNKPPATQYVNKNVGSVMGAHLPQFVDTVAKFHCMKDYMTEEELLPTQIGQYDAFKDLPQPHLIFYGVMYMHGSAVARQIAGGGDKFYSQMDIVAAKNSTQSFAYGDVFTARAPGCYIIDDAETKGNLGQKKATLYALHSEDTGDIAKICAYTKGETAKDRPLYVMAKVGLNSFKDPRIRSILKGFLFPAATKQPFNYVRLRKFGKLHNAEAFLELSNHPAHESQTSWDVLMGDVRGISGMVEVANDLIMMAQKKAVRFLAAPNARVRDYMEGKVPEGLTPMLVWEALLDASTIYSPWYIRARKTPLLGGTGTANSLSVSLEDDDFSNASYRDADHKPREAKSLDRATKDVVPIPKAPKPKITAYLKDNGAEGRKKKKEPVDKNNNNKN